MTSQAFKCRSIFVKNLLSNKVAIVTGGATGIGRAITQELLHLGCKVVIASRNAAKLEACVRDLTPQIEEDSPAQVTAIECNIRKEEQVSNLMSKTMEKFGKIDFLVNNGGGQFISSMEDVSLKGWNAVIETNLTGTFLCCQHAYHEYMKENGGAIVSIIANMFQGMPGMSHSGAARAGVENLMRTLAIEWADKGIRLNCIAPGCIYSETAAANYGTVDVFNYIKPYLPARRFGTPAEVASAVCFLLSPGAAYISGATLRIDGAWSLYDGRHPITDHNKFPVYELHNDPTKSKL